VKWLRRIDDLLEKMERTAAVSIFAGLVGLTVFNILTRNLLQRSFQPALELVPVMVLWLALVGSTLALKERRHIKLDVVTRFFTASGKRAAEVIAGLFGAAVMFLLLFVSASFVRNEMAMFGAAGWLSLVLPVFFALAGFRCILWVLSGTTTGPQSRRPEDRVSEIGP
jgi:TRAP-type C4-dicarboxylate transport system permease small subunit